MFTCDECGKLFTQKNVLANHMHIHEGKTFECTVCGKCFNRRSNLAVHSRLHSIEKPYSCTICERSFCQKVHLLTHVRLHTGEKPFPCEECSMRFVDKNALKRHVKKVHTNEKLFPCSDCSESFHLRSALLLHLKNVHNKDPTFKCNECGKGFYDEFSHTRHMRIHTGENLSNCVECGREFFDDIALVKHMKIHNAETCFSCADCGKRFLSKAKLVCHMKVHTKEKPFACDCGKRFSEKATLRGHMLIHTNEKPYSCECGKSFRGKSTLRRHIRSHSDDRPYTCPQCGASYKVKDNLTKHIRLHITGKTHTCTECSRLFSEKSNMLRHMRTIHGKIPTLEADQPNIPAEILQNFLTNNPSCSNALELLNNSTYPLNRDEALNDRDDKGLIKAISETVFVDDGLVTVDENSTNPEPASVSKSYSEEDALSNAKEKTYTCPCGKNFQGRSSYQAHMRSHSDKRPFCCPHCWMKYKHRDNLSRHVKLHAAGKIHVCTECRRPFSREGNLMFHMRLAHKEKPSLHSDSPNVPSVSTHGSTIFKYSPVFDEEISSQSVFVGDGLATVKEECTTEFALDGESIYNLSSSSSPVSERFGNDPVAVKLELEPDILGYERENESSYFVSDILLGNLEAPENEANLVKGDGANLDNKNVSKVISPKANVKVEKAQVLENSVISVKEEKISEEEDS